MIRTNLTVNLSKLDHDYITSVDEFSQSAMVERGIYLTRNMPTREITVTNPSSEDNLLLRKKQNEIDVLQIENQHLQQTYAVRLHNEIESERNRFDSKIQIYESRLTDGQTEIIKLKEQLNDKSSFQGMLDKIRNQEENARVATAVQLGIDKLDVLKTAFEERLLNAHTEIARLKDQLNSNSKIETLLDTFANKANKVTTAVHLGLEGEAKVCEFIQQNFTDGNLVNSTKTGGQGDFQFYYRGVHFMIEVKNKQTLSNLDVDKFKSNVKTTNADVGIIVSTRDNIRFPCIQNGFHMEFVETNKGSSIPCVYITDFDNCPNTLFGGILAMYHCIQTKKNGQTKDNHEVKYQAVVIAIKTWFPLVDKAVKSSKSNYDSMNSLHDSLLHTLKDFIPEENQTTNNIIQNATTREKAIQLITQYRKENNGKNPSAKHLNTHGITAAHINNLGGLKELNKLAL